MRKRLPSHDGSGLKRQLRAGRKAPAGLPSHDGSGLKRLPSGESTRSKCLPSHDGSGLRISFSLIVG